MNGNRKRNQGEESNRLDRSADIEETRKFKNYRFKKTTSRFTYGKKDRERKKEIKQLGATPKLTKDEKTKKGLAPESIEKKFF